MLNTSKIPEILSACGKNSFIDTIYVRNNAKWIRIRHNLWKVAVKITLKIHWRLVAQNTVSRQPPILSGTLKL
jgi:hypothetical protein